MNITVIIATKNRYYDLHKCLNSLLEQTRLPQKIVIVDASEPFHTLEEFETRCRKKKIEFLQIKSKPGLTLQRNIGIEHASTEIVSFFDDDVILHKEYLQLIVEIFEADSGKRIGGVTGKILNQTDFHPLSILLRKIFLLPEPSKGEVKPSGANNTIHPGIQKIIDVDWLSGCNQNYRKMILDEYKFDEKLTGYSYLEDLVFSYRVGKKYRLIYTPKAKLYHNVQQAKTTRLKEKEKHKMYMINYYYFFKKNMPQTSIHLWAHFWSYIGILIKNILLQRSLSSAIGTLQGIWINLIGKNELVKTLRKSHV